MTQGEYTPFKQLVTTYKKDSHRGHDDWLWTINQLASLANHRPAN